MDRWDPRIAAVACAAVIAAAVSACGGGDAPAPPAQPPSTDLRGLGEAVAAIVPDPPPPPAKPAKGPSFTIARVQPGAKVDLLAAPRLDAPRVRRLDDTTQFGSPQTFYVAERRRRWLGVVATEVPNGELGWIRDDPALVQTYPTGISVEANLSLQTVTVRYGKKIVDRIAVTIGAAGTSTPEGTFAVTDGLAGRKLGPYYGCCVLALSGHQPNLPPGWIGGDRIAIHGTPGAIGGAASAGCLRASDPDMVALFALVPLGAPVFIHS